ncbi:MAG TPA: hypothetical protein VNN17_11580 [Terriglobia bacterium]|nr:hypothetical protein [Terriglobia bacterium]
MPLGLLMVSEGWISESDLREALAAQRTAEGGRIGEWMCRRGVATEQQVTSALSRQWARPVFSLEGNTHFLQYAGMIPLPLLEAAQMVPVHYLPQSQHLYVAFALGIDYSVLYGAEQMLSCRTEPCLAAQSSVRSALERIREQPRPPEIVFDGGQDLRETGQTILNYVAQLGAEQVRLARCGRHLWVRLQSAQQSTHLLFC